MVLHDVYVQLLLTKLVSGLNLKVWPKVIFSVLIGLN